MAEAMEPTLAGAERAAPQKTMTPEELAPYFPQLEILDCLGRGGMGVVYKARQKSLNRVVALKLLAPERADDAGFAERFRKEAQALAALNHPHIVTVYDFGQAGSFYFLLMEFVDGVNLRQAMRAGRFTPTQALAIVPHSLVAGTPQYMAPEQKSHGVIDHRADIYSLGVVLYELLTGELPADKLQPPSSRLRGLQIDVRLDEIVLRAMEKRPELRYQQVSDVKTMCETIATNPPPASPPETPVATGSSPVREKPDLIAKLLLFSPIVGVRNGRRVIHWAGWRSNGILFLVVMAVVFVPAVLSGEHIAGWLVSFFLFVLGMIVANAVRDCRKPIEQLPSLDVKVVSKTPPAFVVFGSLYFALVFVLMTSASLLPDRVACHFGLDGNADDWMGRVPYLLLIAAIPAVMALMFAFVSRRIRTAGASFITIPRRDYWLAPDRRATTAALIRDRLMWLLCLLTLFFGSLHVLTVAANRTSPPHLNMGALLVVVIVFLVAMMMWLFMLVMRFAEADDRRGGTAPPPFSRAAMKQQIRNYFRVILPVGLVVSLPLVENATAVAAPAPKITTDQIIVEDLALQMIVAVREKDDNKLRVLACDAVKGWRDALPAFAVEMREHYRQLTGNEAFDMRAVESLVDSNLAVVKCTGPKELSGIYLVLFFVKTHDGWHNWMLRNSPPERRLNEFMNEKPPSAATDLKGAKP